MKCNNDCTPSKFHHELWQGALAGFNFYLNGELKTGPVVTGGLVSPITPGGVLMFGQEPDAYGTIDGGWWFDRRVDAMKWLLIGLAAIVVLAILIAIRPHRIARPLPPMA